METESTRAVSPTTPVRMPRSDARMPPPLIQPHHQRNAYRILFTLWFTHSNVLVHFMKFSFSVHTFRYPGGAFLLFFAVCFGAFRTTTLQAQQFDGDDRYVVTTAVPFLLISPDSRSGALADAGVALVDNANATYYNHSVLAFTENKFGFAVNYTPWLRNIVPDINHAYVPIYYNFGDKGGVVGGALTFFSLGDINFTDFEGNSIGQYNANEVAISAHYTRKLTDNFSAGVGLRYIHSNLTGGVSGLPLDPANSVSGDITVFYTKDFQFRRQTDMNFSFGTAISNLGAKVNYTRSEQGEQDFLPANLKLGYALTAYLDEHNSFTLTNDFNKLLVPTPDPDGDFRQKDVMSGVFGSFGDAPGGFSEEMSEITASVGVEYWYSTERDNPLFAGRIGYFYEDPDKGNRRYLSFGVGLRLKVFSLDMAYLVPFETNHPLQNTLRFTLAFEFGGEQ